MFKSFRKKPNGQSGVTLIEVIISLGMVGGLIVLYAAAFNVSILTRNLRNENLAYHIANRKMEEIRATEYLALPPSAPFVDPLFSHMVNGTGSYTINDYLTFDGLKEVVVTVSWTDGRTRTVSIRTLIGSGGINP